MRRFPSRPLLAALLVTLSACSSSTRTELPAWSEAVLPSYSASTVLLGVAFNSSRAIAVGAEVGAGTAKPVMLDNPGGGWGAIFPPDLPVSGTLTGVAFTKDGEGIVTGFEGTTMPAPFLFDERGGWHRPTLTGSNGTLAAAVRAGGDSMWVCGAADGGLFYMSTNALNWTRVPAGLGTPQEKGFRDLSYRDGVVYACGWDDGEEPYSVVMANAGGGWQKLPNPDPATLDVEFDSILIDDEGTLWVGGHVVEGVPQGDVILLKDVARLYRRPRGGVWSRVTLPAPDQIGSITDIVQMSWGTIYFAAGGDVRLLVWANSEVREIVLPELDGTLNALAEGPGGMLYAAGAKLGGAAGATFVPLMLKGRVGPATTSASLPGAAGRPALP